MTTGQVRILGKRPDRLDPEPIEDRLRRRAAAPAFAILIFPDLNEITLSLSLIARNGLGRGDLASRPAIEAQLAEVFGKEWSNYWESGLTFGAVLVEVTSLRAAMAGAGHMLPECAAAGANALARYVGVDPVRRSIGSCAADSRLHQRRRDESAHGGATGRRIARRYSDTG